MDKEKDHTGGRLPSLDEMYNFLKHRYKNDRFDGRDGKTWGEDYSTLIAKGRLDDLRKYGFSFISQHESKTGVVLKFDRGMVINGQN